MKIASVERTIWFSLGTALAGYDESGKLVIVVTVETKHPAKWMMSGVSKADWARVRREAALAHKDEDNH